MPIFVAGGIATGKMIAHLALMGAAGAQMGTRFVWPRSATPTTKFKEVFIKARAREAISTPQYSAKLPVVSVRALNNHAMTHFGELQLELLEKLRQGEINRQDAQFKVEEYWVGSLRDAAVDGDVEHGSLMAGQSVGMVRPGPAPAGDPAGAGGRGRCRAGGGTPAPGCVGGCTPRGEGRLDPDCRPAGRLFRPLRPTDCRIGLETGLTESVPTPAWHRT